ncbi:hypothetical protein ACFUJR_34840 [Streptomyces sp. NPDC057271]|uniref:hypothetical protein n=1 Tax=unclassified Streptomyces TaxID=2593676 RepID=UPI00362FF003
MLTTTLVVAPVQAVVTGPSSFAPVVGLVPCFDGDGAADGDAAVGWVDGFGAGACPVDDVPVDGFEDAAADSASSPWQAVSDSAAIRAVAAVVVTRVVMRIGLPP